MKLWFKCIAAVVVGASQSIFPLFAMTSVLSMLTPSPTIAQEHKIGSLPLVLASWEKADRMKDKMEIDKKSGVDSKDKYDFIVVGAGTAGSIIAARLSEHFSVLLLEAGGQPHASLDNPAMSMMMTKHPETDWMYESVIQNESCVLCPGRKYIFSSGKGFGGSANLNYIDTLYEGAFQDYTEWMEITEDPGWGYYMLQPYFKTVKEYMLKKYPVSPGESQYYRSTYKALIRPKANLDVQKYSHVHKVIFDDDNKLQARGVEYERHGQIRQAFVNKELIMSAGIFGSPKILMLSGIGRESILNSSEIPVRIELPVGLNFHDHLAIPLGPFFRSIENDPVGETSDIRTRFYEAWNSSTILRMPLVNLKYHLYAKEMFHFFGMNETTVKKYMDASHTPKKSVTLRDDDSMFINVAIKKPISRGEVTVAGKDPKLAPIINPNYLNAIYHHDTFAYSSEKQKLIEALEETVRLMEANPNVKAKFTQATFPGCEHYIFRGYGYWDCYIRHFSMSFNHGVGTCAMGAKKSLSTSVVDAELKVHGIQGLRVVDASVIPTLVGTYPFQSVAVVAEKGADMIIKQHKSSRKSATVTQLEINEEEHARQDHQLFSGFSIKKLTSPVITTPVPVPFTMSKSWQKADQIVQKSYSHTADSSLSESDLIPPGEPVNERPNPSYFPVRPLAGRLIFYPMIPQTQEKGNTFQYKEASRADVIL